MDTAKPQQGGQHELEKDSFGKVISRLLPQLLHFQDVENAMQALKS